MSNLTKELLTDKLTEWTPSTKVQETLGLSSMDEVLFKKELAAFEEKGIIERDGARRGLKFRVCMGDVTEKVSTKADKSPKAKESKVKEKKQPSLEKISDIHCEVSILPKHEHTSAGLNNAAITKLIDFIMHGSSDSSRALVIKRNHGKVIVKTYNEAYLLSDVSYTKENFSKLLKLSGISLEDVDE